MTELLSYGQPWKTISALVKKQPKHCLVAVAYFGTGASKLLPLGAGSTLVVDVSERAVSSGQTKPSEVLKLVNKGVDAYSVNNLHAKVFVIGRRALVGSTNASNTSAHGLVEAALDTTDSGAVSGCRRFIMGLCGDPATPEHLKRLRKLWRGPKFGLGGKQSTQKSSGPTLPEHSTVWVAPLEYTTFDAEDEKARRRGRARAKRRILSRGLYHLDQFKLDQSWAAPLKRYDLIVEVLDEGNGVQMVSRPARILDIDNYRSGRARPSMVSVERARKDRRKNLEIMMRSLPQSGRILKELERPRKIRDRLLANALIRGWPRLQRT